MVLYVAQNKRITRRHVALTLMLALNIVLSHFAAIWMRLGWHEASAAQGGGYDWMAGVLWLHENWIALCVSVVVYALVFYAGGMYEPPVRRRRETFDALPLVTVLISASLVGLMFYAGSGAKASMGRGIWAIASVLTLLLSYLMRGIQLLLIRRGHFRRRAIVLSDSDEGVETARRLLRRANVPIYHVLGVVRCDRGGARGKIPVPKPGEQPPEFPNPQDPDAPWPILGTAGELEKVVDRYDVVAVMAELTPDYPTAVLARLRHLRYSGVSIFDHVALSEQLAHEIPLSHINEQWLMSAALNSSVVQIHHLKRAMDVILSLVAIVPGVPLLLLGMLLVRLTSRGPVFYHQRRVGLGGKPFTLYKLRTMRADAEKGKAVWAASNDNRVTPVGHFLRTFRWDEIPQIYNILRGEMSWVGPRPERPEFTRKLAEVIPFYDERHLVRPGLTGWAQVCYPYGASVEAAARKLQYDLYYIKNMTLLLDLSILLRTTKTILVGLAHEDDELPESEADALTLEEIVGDSSPKSNAPE